METKKILTILVLAFGLMVWSAPIVHGAQYLTVNGQPVASITLELGQSCTVEVVSDDSMAYTDVVGFSKGHPVLGTFSHYQTTPLAGDGATVTEYNTKPFYGYLVVARGRNILPSPGVHFIFEYVAQQVGETDVKLYDETLTSELDSVHITVIPLVPKPMGTAFTYQGRLLDADSPADGLYDFEFKLYDNPGPFASQEGNTIDINDLDVIDGQFVVELDFGSDVFAGYARWLQVGVRPGEFSDPCEYTVLSPRVELTPTPYAIYAETAGGDNDWMVSGNDMYSIPSGNVGIGTTIPGKKLEVNSGSDTIVTRFTTNAVASGIMFHNSTVATDSVGVGAQGGDLRLLTDFKDRVAIKDNGNVGIGTTVPDLNLSVWEGMNIDQSNSNDGSIGPGLRFGSGSSGEGIASKRTPGGNQYGLDFYTGVAKRMSITSSGNVGIGTSDPVSKLEVNGRLELPGNDASGTPGTGAIEIGNSLRLDDNEIITNTDETLYIQRDNNGNVGIGTLGPANGKLEVNGEISTGHGGLRWKLFSGTTGSSSVSRSHGLDASKIFSISCVLRDGPTGAGMAQEVHRPAAGPNSFRVSFDDTTVYISSIGDYYDDADDRYRCIVWYIDS